MKDLRRNVDTGVYAETFWTKTIVESILIRDPVDTEPIAERRPSKTTSGTTTTHNPHSSIRRKGKPINPRSTAEDVSPPLVDPVVMVLGVASRMMQSTAGPSLIVPTLPPLPQQQHSLLTLFSFKKNKMQSL